MEEHEYEGEKENKENEEEEDKKEKEEKEKEEEKEEEEEEIVDEDDVIPLDYRIIWVRDRVMKFLGISGYEHLFDQLINANNRYLEDKLHNFLMLDLYDVKDLEKRVIYFYKTYADEMYQEEIILWEENQRAKITAFTSKSRAYRLSAFEKVKKPEKKRRRRRRRRGRSKIDTDVPTLEVMTPSIPESSDSEMGETEAEEEDGRGDFVKKEEDKILPPDFVPPPGEEDKYIQIKKIVDKVRQIPVLHMICGEIDTSKVDPEVSTFFYFLRTSDEGIPPYDSYQECLGEITNYVIVGTLNSKFLFSLSRMLSDVFRPLVESQFRGPEISEFWLAKFLEEEEAISVYTISALTRPSAFRRASELVAKQELDIRKEEDFEIKDVDITKIDKTKEMVKRSLSVSESKASRTASLKELKELQPMLEQSKKDILDYLNNFIKIVDWTTEHMEDEILLMIPNIPELADPTITNEMFIKNEDIMEELGEVVAIWEQHIRKVQEAYISKQPPGKGPIAEFTYWQECETGLTMLVEQLKMPIIKRVLEIMELTASPVALSFQYFQSELWKNYIQARDNNRFIQTLLRYFKLITDSDSFETITETIPPLMEGLRMLWVLSSFYSNEEKMMQLMDRIAWQLCTTLKKHLRISTLFMQPLPAVLSKTKTGSEMMKKWRQSYMKTRLDIELSGKGNRWEFDQKRLFSDTEYLAEVANDLYNVAVVLQDFYNIFGPDLKSIINDPAQIDAVVKRVNTLVIPIQEIEFDAFNLFNKAEWEELIAWFYEEVTYLEDQAKFYIDECFNVLINAEDALQMLLKFKTLKTRESIQQQLLWKFDLIMQQFSKEISIVENIFHRNKRFPPLLTYHPPMAGAIFWVRQLFLRLRKAVLRFQQVEELKHNERKLIAFNQYHEVAKQLKDFEEAKFSTWLEKAQQMVISTMKKSVLRIINTEPNPLTTLVFPENKDFSIRTHQTFLKKDIPMLAFPIHESLLKHDLSMKLDKDTSIKDNPSIMSSEKHETNARLKPEEVMNNAVLMECQLHFQLNFDWNMFEVIREAELMEQLGFDLPVTIRDVGVQKNRLRTDIYATEKMIKQYNSILKMLDKADVQLLKQILQDIEKHIQPGVTRFNWNSLSILDYASSCRTMLKYLDSIIEQINQLKKDLENWIESELQSYNLFSVRKELANELLICKTYFLEVHSRRNKLILSMLKTYKSISPMLIKLESLVLNTATGKSPSMQLLYEKFEKKIFAAFITCMSKNMEVLNKTLNGIEPIFQVDAILIASEVMLRPSPSEIYNLFCLDVRDLLERLKGFSRWMNGTCLECEPQKKELTEETITFSFFEDVMSIQIINDLVKAIQDTAYKISLECWRYLQQWKKYSNLWSFDKNLACEKFAATKPTLRQYDEKFTFYESVLKELEEMADYFDIHSVRLNLKPLLTSIERHAKEWKQVLGNFLLIDTVFAMNELKTQIETFRAEVELVITGMDRFMSIMEAIADIKRVAVQVEVQFLSYQECFKTLRVHDVTFSLADEEMAYQLQRDWESLYLGALYRTSTLETTSDKFAELTEDEIRQFLDELERFARDFEAHGPGSIGDDLDTGLQKMEIYGKEIQKYEEKRQNMIKSEILFDLMPTDYTVFLNVKKDYEAMETLYDLYSQQKSAREVWAQTLWVNLNPQLLIDGMEGFIREFRRLPRAMRKMNVGLALDVNMKNFKNSVPLFVELKNEAMRDRHWEELMARTGQYFDMDPERCEDDDS